jgi:hypothetical protein
VRVDPFKLLRDAEERERRVKEKVAADPALAQRIRDQNQRMVFRNAAQGYNRPVEHSPAVRMLLRSNGDS